MRCPKCQYISFDSGDRCRNCGYEFSLAVDVEALDLPIQTGDEAIGPLGDLALTDLDAPLAPAPGRDAGYTPPNGGFPLRGPVPAPRAPTPVRVQPAAPVDGPPDPPRSNPRAPELPLFNDRTFDDRPLVTPPAVPRAPLSVRRSGPPAPRAHARASVDEPELELEMPQPARRPVVSRPAPPDTTNAAGQAPASGIAAASAADRTLAGAVDVLLLASIDAAVLYFTLQLVGFEFRETLLLPRGPLLGFWLLLNGGYFVLFTVAGGQTIGKMLAGIKVVPADEDAYSDRVPFGHAALRTVAYLVSVLPAGLGFLPAFIGRDGRALHDRLADTRVVQA